MAPKIPPFRSLFGGKPPKPPEGYDDRPSVAPRGPEAAPQRSAVPFQAAIKWFGAVLGTNKGPQSVDVDSPTQPVAEINQPVIRLITPADPAVGNNSVRVFVPNNEIWEVQSIHFLLTTSAVAGVRFARVSFLGVGPSPVAGPFPLLFTVGGNFDQGPSLAVNYSAGAFGIVGNTLVSGDEAIVIPLPVGYKLLPGQHIGLGFGNNQVGDAISGIAIQLKVWPTQQVAEQA